MFPDIELVHSVRDELEDIIEEGVNHIVQLLKNTESRGGENDDAMLHKGQIKKKGQIKEKGQIKKPPSRLKRPIKKSDSSTSTESKTPNIAESKLTKQHSLSE